MGVEEPKAPTKGIPQPYKLKNEAKEENLPEDISTYLTVKEEVEEKPQYQSHSNQK